MTTTVHLELLNQSGATVGDVPQWSGTKWVPAPVSGGGNNTVVSATDPTATDDSGDGYVIGQTWVNTVDDAVFILTDASAGAAVWNVLATEPYVAASIATHVGLADPHTQYRLEAANIAQSDVTNLTTDLANKQALDADLSAIAALSAIGGWAKRTAADTWIISVPTASDVGADPVGTSTAGIAAHVALSDPHTQYAKISGDTFTGDVYFNTRLQCSLDSSVPTTTTKIRFGRSSSQYITFHGSSGSQNITAVSGAAPKPYIDFGISVDDGATIATSYRLEGASGAIHTAGKASLFPSGTAAAPAIQIGAADEGFFRSSSGVTGWADAGIEYLRWSGGRLELKTNAADWYDPGVPSMGSNSITIYGSDGTNAGFRSVAIGGTATFVGRRANGTGAVPTALLNNQSAFELTVNGYKASAWSATAARIFNEASEDWTDTATGNRWVFEVCPNTSLSRIEGLILDHTGQTLHHSGTAALPSISFINDTDTGLRSVTGNIVAMSTNAVTRMEWTASDVRQHGWGTQAIAGLVRHNGTEALPTAVLDAEVLGEIRFGGQYGTAATDYDLNVAGIQAFAETNFSLTDRAGYLAFLTTATVGTNWGVRWRINHTGELVGGDYNSSTFAYSVIPRLQVLGTSAGVTTLGMARFANDATSGGIYGAKSRGTITAGTTGTLVATQTDDNLFGISGQGVDSAGTAFREAASILFEQDGASGATGVPGRITFNTADSAGVLTEAMRIDTARVVTVYKPLKVAVGSDTATTSAELWLQRESITNGVNRQVMSGDRMGIIRFVGRDSGNTYSTGTYVMGIASEDWTATNHGAKLLFGVTAVGSTTSGTRAVLEDDGQFQFSDGTATSPGIGFIGDSDTGIYRTTSNEIGITLGTTLRATFSAAAFRYDGYAAGPYLRTVRANGNMAAPTKVLSGQTLGEWQAGGYYDNSVSGTGTTYKVDIVSIRGVADEDYSGGSAKLGGHITFLTTAIGAASQTNRWRIDDGGQLCGEDRPAITTLSGTQVPYLQLASSGASGHNAALMRFNADASGPTFFGAKSKVSTVGSYTTTATGDTLFTISAQGVDTAATAFREAASIAFTQDGAAGVGVPGKISFKTSGSGATTLFDALVLDAAQDATFGGKIILPAGTTSADGIQLGGSNIYETGSGLLRIGDTGDAIAFLGGTPAVRRTMAAATGTATRTTFDTATVTLAQLAERVKALIDDLRSYNLHG